MENINNPRSSTIAGGLATLLKAKPNSWQAKQQPMAQMAKRAEHIFHFFLAQQSFLLEIHLKRTASCLRLSNLSVTSVLVDHEAELQIT